MAPAASARLASCPRLPASQALFINLTGSFATNSRCATHPQPWRSRSPMSAASNCRRVGVILAAGRGGRMGGKKQLTPWPTAAGTIPLVAASYDAIRPICDEMVVVLGHAANEIAVALGARPFHRAESDPHAPMFESIRAGLRFSQGLNPAAAIVLQ